PALAALVELDLAEALPPPRLAQAEIELAHVVVAPELVGRTVEDDPAVLHDVAVVGDAERDLSVLLDEQDGGPLLGVDLLDDLEDLAHQQRSDGERLEDLAPFHHLHDTEPADLLRIPAVDPSPHELDAAVGHLAVLGLEQPRDGLERRGLARPVGAQQRHDLALGDVERESLEDQDHVTVDDLDVVQSQHRCKWRATTGPPPPPPAQLPPGNPRPPPRPRAPFLPPRAPPAP